MSWLSSNPTSGVISAGGSEAVSIDFDADGLFGGLYEAVLEIGSNDPATPLAEVPVSLNVTGAPDISASDLSIAFGEQFLGTDSQQILVVSNDGTDQLVVSNISAANSDYSVSTTSFELAPKEDQEVVVTYSPSESGQ